MPFDGSGNYTPAASPNFPAVGGTVITAAYYNNVINDIAAALSNCLTRDGQGKPSADFNWNNKDLTNVADFQAATANILGALTLGTPLAVAEGGIGADNPADGRTNLGATTVGAAIFTLANPSAIRFLRLNADNTVSALSGADFRTAISAGTVSSVSGAGTANGLTLTGTVTTSGSLTLGGTLSGVDLTSAVTGILPVPNGGTGAASITSGRLVKGNGTGAFTASGIADNSDAVAITIDSGENVGIGTSTAGAGTRLNVSGRGLFTGGTFDPFDGSASGVSISYDTVNNIGFVAAVQTGVSSRQLNILGNPIAFLTSSSEERLRVLATGAITSADLADAAGYKGLPQNPRTANYTLALSDQGYDIYITGTTAGQTITIPANSSVAFPVGTMIQITNDSNQNWSIAITTDTLLWSPNNVTGTRTLAPAGQVTVRKVSATRWWISGGGLT